MDFHRGLRREEPEINLIPLIDLLLVIVIFLAAATTYSKYAELRITLPKADANAAEQKPREIDVAVDAQGAYFIDRQPVPARDAAGLSAALRAAGAGAEDPVVVIHADGSASHQSVIHVMEAARMAGYVRITFTTDASAN